MPNYVAVSLELHADKRWARSSNFKFAAHDALSPLVMKEVPTAILSVPIAFSKVDDHFGLFAVQGLEPGRNNLVDASGNWLTDYIPAIYRGYPFALAETDDEKQILCVDGESPLIADTGEHRFFNDNGEPTTQIKETLEFLSEVAGFRLLTHTLCLLLEELDLLEPWLINIKKGEEEVPLEGLYRVNETKFNNVDIETLAKLRDKRALPLIFSQLLSMQNLARVAKLGASQGNGADLPKELEFDYADNDGNISFAGL